MRLDTARRYALSLPETSEEPHFELSSFRVKGKIFATVPTTGRHLHVHADAGEIEALVEGEPAAYERIIWGKRTVDGWVRVNLPAADRREVEELLEEAWRRKAPKRVVAAYDAARQG
jgi:hypothetical protein